MGRGDRGCSARDADYRVRAQGYRAIAQFRFRQKLELLRRGLEDDSPAARGSAPSRSSRSRATTRATSTRSARLLHELAARPERAVRRLAVVCLRNGSPRPDTIQLLEGIAESEDEDAELRKSARAVQAAREEEGDGA